MAKSHFNKNKGIRINIIVITGDGRCGSTLLDRTLGHSFEAISTNELCRFTKYGCIENRLCACGKKFWDCTFWKRVSKLAGLDRNNYREIEKMEKLSKIFDSSHQFLCLLYFKNWMVNRHRLKEYIKYLQRLYLSIQIITRNNIIIDSSKIPTRTLLLELAGFNTYTVHLVRDPRAVVYSWTKNKFNPANNKSIEIHNLFQSVNSWISRNAFSTLLRIGNAGNRYAYEDFCEDPQEQIELISKYAEKAFNQMVTIKKKFVNEIELAPIHSISGNPNRFEHGKIQITIDNDWKKLLSFWSKLVTTIATLPFLIYYNYLYPKRNKKTRVK